VAKPDLGLIEYPAHEGKPVVLIFGEPNHKPTSILANPSSQQIAIPTSMNLQQLALEEAERFYAALGNTLNILHGPEPKTVLIGANDKVYINGQPVEHLL